MKVPFLFQLHLFSKVQYSYRNRAFWRMISSELQHRGSAPKGWRHRERKNIAKELESVRELSPPQSSGGERIMSGPGSWVDAKAPRSSFSVCFKVRRGTQKGSALLGFVRFNSEYMTNDYNFIYFKQLDSVGLLIFLFFFLTFNVEVLTPNLNTDSEKGTSWLTTGCATIRTKTSLSESRRHFSHCQSCGFQSGFVLRRRDLFHRQADGINFTFTPLDISAESTGFLLISRPDQSETEGRKLNNKWVSCR